MDTGLTRVAVDVANVGANYEFMLCRHQCDMRVYLEISIQIDIYIYIYKLVDR